METYDLRKITAQDFRDYLGRKLPVAFVPSGTVPATVKSIADLDNYSPLERNAFSVVLQAEGDQHHRPQGIYRLIHPRAGLLDLFLVPIGTDQHGMKYEAVFS